MVNTGWKSPLNVSQDSRRAVNNNHACYNFVDLNDIRGDDFHYAYIPTSGGIDSIRASPVIYAYNYNFNIPSNAVIKNVYVLPIFQQGNGKGYGNVTKLKTLKLKTGSSLTDYGVGNNLANNDFIQKVQIPIGSWTTESTWKKADKYIFGGGGLSDWGLTLTPSIVNSTNFGCVFQVMGTKLKKWVNPRVAKLLMKIEYTTPEVTEDETLGVSSQKVECYIGNEKVEWNDNYTSNKIFTGLDVDKKDTSVNMKVKITHEGRSGESMNMSCSSNNILLSDLKQKVYSFPSIHFNADKTAKDYEFNLKLYPAFVGGTQILSFIYDNTPRYIRFSVANDSFSSMSDVEKEKFMSDGQFCMITGCKFNKNSASVNGGAMYIITEHFQYGKNTYGSSDNANTVGTSSGVPNLWYNGNKMNKNN